MALKRRTAEQAHETRERIERDLERVLARSLRRFLARLSREAQEAARATALTAAASDDYPTLGTVYGWWVAEVDESVLVALREAYRAVWHEVATGRITETSLDAAETYLGRVRDRLVRGLEPPLPDDAFDAVRVSVAQALAEGWSRDDLAQRIAAELSWEERGAYWRGQLAQADAAIDAILDPLGEPGSPAREHARLHDPRVRELQAGRSRALRHLDGERSYWATRALAIARTEATGAANYGALNALTQEGSPGKEWLAVNQPGRTRPEHAAASGQVVPVDAPFVVGGYNMQMPGDPNAPAHLVVNCRCTIVGADLPE